MEKILKILFDFQRFENHPALQSVIDSVHSHHTARKLDISEMEWVSAAGMPGIRPVRKEKE